MAWFGRNEQRRAVEKIKAVKWRQWVFMPALPVTGAAFVVNTIVVIEALESFTNYSDDKGGHFSFYDLPHGPVRSKMVSAVSVEVVGLAVLWAETIHFAIFFHRDDHVHRRCTIQACLSALLIVFAAVMKVLDDQIAVMPVAFDTITAKRPDLTAEQFDTIYNLWRDYVFLSTGLIAFIVAIVNGAIHAIVLVFWLWLLPARHRLPNRYELVAMTDMADIGPLETVFQEHEQARLLRGRNSLNMPSKTAQGSSSVPALSKGPQFDPIVRYWMVNPLRDGGWGVTAVFLSFFFVAPVFEVIIYSLTKRYDLRCQWDCYLDIAYPWPIILWALSIGILLWMKIPFNRRVFAKGPRLDVLVTIIALAFIPVWLLVHITRFADFSLEGSDTYQDYIKSDSGRSTAAGKGSSE
ncbi:hypothetical protein ONZ43_g2984 [Nemania bipapillata]|uniref:Uncharacterized protein n=1 Tax=Nemania bipapillata TaxID=110536 RepID=A0ACC2IYF8_9PEZI|nr:hypothetical protein ONZ43_g2984 [Nemania bipapillata]